MGSWKILLFNSEALKLNQKKFCQFSSEAKESSTATFLWQLITIIEAIVVVVVVFFKRPQQGFTLSDLW